MTSPPTPDAERTTRLHASPAVRLLLWSCGAISLALGVIGVAVPGLPTTPFVLIAGACFVRASPRAHAWLLRNRTFGPILREWDLYRSVQFRVKRIAFVTMALTGGASLWFLDGRPWLQMMVLTGVLAGTLTVWWLPTRDE